MLLEMLPSRSGLLRIWSTMLSSSISACQIRMAFSLILRLRQLGVTAPVLILSARRSVDDRVRGLEQGGDDYLTKPFALAELLARLRNLLSEAAPQAPKPRACACWIWNSICCAARQPEAERS